MGRRDLHIVLMYASSLRRQDQRYRMVVRAEAYITNDSMPVQYTSADGAGDVNPRWDHPLSFSLHCSSRGRRSAEHLNINLINTMPDGSSLVIGSLKIPLVTFLSGSSERATGSINARCPVSTGGHLYFSYRLGAYVSGFPNILRVIGRVARGSILHSVFGFVFNDIFGQ